MRYIIVYDIEGIGKSEIGYKKELYTFEEMIHYKDYAHSQLEWDRDIEERDHPSGWVIQERVGKFWVFIPVFEFEKWEELPHECKGNCKNCTCKH